MSEQLRQDLYHKVIADPRDLLNIRAFVVAQGRAIHASRKHAATCGSYGREKFEECRVRWCIAARLIAGTEIPPEPPGFVY